MKISYDKWYPVVQPQAMVQQELFIKKVEKQNAEYALQVQIDQMKGGLAVLKGLGALLGVGGIGTLLAWLQYR